MEAQILEQDPSLVYVLFAKTWKRFSLLSLPYPLSWIESDMQRIWEDSNRNSSEGFVTCLTAPANISSDFLRTTRQEEGVRGKSVDRENS